MKIYAQIIVCILILALHSTTFASNLGTIKVGYIPVGDCLQLFVAEELGYFTEQGLTLEKQAVKGGALIAMAVESEDLDLGWSNLVSLAIARDKGFPFKVLSPGAYEDERGHRVHSLLIKADSPIASVKDLKGKTIAINTLGNVNDLAVTALAVQHGLTSQDFKLIELPFPQMEAALADGSVDCVLTLEPFVTKALSSGTAKTLEPAALKVYGDHFLLAAWFSTEKWVAKHPEQAAAFSAAVRKASEFISANPDQARGILIRHTGLTPELAQKIAMPAFATDIFVGDVQPMLDLTLAFKYIKTALDPQTLFFDTLTPSKPKS